MLPVITGPSIKHSKEFSSVQWAHPSKASLFPNSNMSVSAAPQTHCMDVGYESKPNLNGTCTKFLASVPFVHWVCPALTPNIQLYYFCSSVFEKSNTHKAQTCNGHILKLHCSLLATEPWMKGYAFMEWLSRVLRSINGWCNKDQIIPCWHCWCCACFILFSLKVLHWESLVNLHVAFQELT